MALFDLSVYAFCYGESRNSARLSPSMRRYYDVPFVFFVFDATECRVLNSSVGKKGVGKVCRLNTNDRLELLDYVGESERIGDCAGVGVLYCHAQSAQLDFMARRVDVLVAVQFVFVCVVDYASGQRRCVYVVVASGYFYCAALVASDHFASAGARAPFPDCQHGESGGSADCLSRGICCVCTRILVGCAVGSSSEWFVSGYKLSRAGHAVSVVFCLCVSGLHSDRGEFIARAKICGCRAARPIDTAVVCDTVGGNGRRLVHHWYAISMGDSGVDTGFVDGRGRFVFGIFGLAVRGVFGRAFH